MNVLFSAVGGTDPITNCKDGALLHICRNYRPDKVYMYLSAEMCEYHDRDDRYRQAIHHLEQHLNWSCEIVVIEDREMKDVQIFDAFIEPFEKMLDQIVRQDEPQQLYLNVSSGTPAMKSSLQLLSLLWDNCEAIQVATPERSSNKVHEDKNTYDLDLQWEMNEDNDPDYENRCMMSHARKLLDRILKEKIASLIHGYDYEAAKMMLEELSQRPSDMMYQMLEVAIERQKLAINASRLAQYKKKLPIGDWFLRSGQEGVHDFEYLMVMQTKLRRGQYVDFARDITPILFSLSERLLKKECALSFEDIGYEDYSTGSYRLAPEKLESRGLMLKEYWNNKPFISSEIVLSIMASLSADRRVIQALQEIRDAEIKIRNKSAHEVFGLTREKFEKKLGIRPEKLMSKLIQLAKFSGIAITKEDEHCYEFMNEQLCRQLRNELE